ncbi:MAG: nitroreductase family protein [Candidatus Lokiarchaeota archaeon]|nr:nitroreductase family protein [Candidatus Lokiarchaeota archaeon]
MPIIGIDYEKCNKCKICVYTCPRYFSVDKEQDKIVFEDSQNECNLCGRCIAMCPTDAILYEDIGDVLTFKEAQNPSALVPYETLHKFMSSKRSVRGFKTKKIPRDLMEKVLDSMKYAPTGANVRTLECTILSDKVIIKKLSESVIDALIATNSPGYSEGAKMARKSGFDMIFYNAPHVMIIHSSNPNDSLNATIALTYGMFAAQSLGLGTCWIGLARGVLATSKEVRENIMGINGYVWGVITIGYPAQNFFRVPPRPSLKIKGLDELE